MFSFVACNFFRDQVVSGVFITGAGGATTQAARRVRGQTPRAGRRLAPAEGGAGAAGTGGTGVIGAV